MFLPLLWPFIERSITKMNKKLQTFVNQTTDVKY